MSCGVGHRLSSDPTVATAPIGPLAWKPPYAEGVALKRQKKKKRKKKSKEAAGGWLLGRLQTEVHTGETLVSGI